ncbi:hypothetical protein LINPERPRIM_LOCUS11885 [Linum perenne]
MLQPVGRLNLKSCFIWLTHTQFVCKTTNK